mgnify:FL=1
MPVPENMLHILEGKRYRLEFLNLYIAPSGFPSSLHDAETGSKISGNVSYLIFTTHGNGQVDWNPTISIKTPPGAFMKIVVPNMQSNEWRDKYHKGFYIKIIKKRPYLCFDNEDPILLDLY